MATRMPTIPKKELLLHVINNIKDSGWDVQLVNSINDYPLRAILTKGEEREEVVIYIWNISHGGKTRSSEEYRIQIKGIEPPLLVGEDFKTLLLGWYNQGKVFAAFDSVKHMNFGRSPSLQVTKSKLQEAFDHGIAFQEKKTKNGREIVVTFAPNFIMDYIKDIYPQYHTGAKEEISNIETEVLLKNPLDIKIPVDELNKLPSPRKKIVTTINKKVRERRFQVYIRRLYLGKCAVCGIQANLTEAAHIIAVKEDGTDEIANGILLCSNHHKAYDFGLLAIDSDYKILVNKNIVGQLRKIKQDGKLTEFLKGSRIGEKIFLPDKSKFHPKKEYLSENCKSKGI